MLLVLMQDFSMWLIEDERDEIADICREISRHLRQANTIWPNYYAEYIERRLELDRARECCNALQDELQYIAEQLPADKNRYMGIVLDIEKEFNLIKRHRLKAYKRLLACGRMNEEEIENAFKSWMVLNYKVMSRMQIQGIYEVYKELFGKEITWKTSRLRYLTANSSKTLS